MADSEARLMNTTYTEAMADRTSAEFRAVADPFCDEVSVYTLYQTITLARTMRCGFYGCTNDIKSLLLRL